MTKTIEVSDETFEKIKDQLKEEPKKKTEILNRSGKVIYSSDKETLREAVIEAVKSGADLSNANLSYADLSNADLSNANLSYADLSNANLFNANLFDAKTNMCKVNFSKSEYKQAKQFIEGLN